MFRTLIHPSSGACDFSIVSPHWLCVPVSMCVGVSLWLGWSGICVAGWSTTLSKYFQFGPVSYKICTQADNQKVTVATQFIDFIAYLNVINEKQGGDPISTTFTARDTSHRATQDFVCLYLQSQEVSTRSVQPEYGLHFPGIYAAPIGS